MEDMLAGLGCAVVGTAGNLNYARGLARTLAVDLAILDVNLAGERIFQLRRSHAKRGRAVRQAQCRHDSRPSRRRSRGRPPAGNRPERGLLSPGRPARACRIRSSGRFARRKRLAFTAGRSWERY